MSYKLLLMDHLAQHFIEAVEYPLRRFPLSLHGGLILIIPVEALLSGQYFPAQRLESLLGGLWMLVL